MSHEEIPCYVGRKTCGCYVAAMVAPLTPKSSALREAANALAEWERDGLVIEMSTVGAVRGGLLGKCPHEPTQTDLPGVPR